MVFLPGRLVMDRKAAADEKSGCTNLMEKVYARLHIVIYEILYYHKSASDLSLVRRGGTPKIRFFPVEFPTVHLMRIERYVEKGRATMMNTSLLQKSGLATLQVAQILAGLEPGNRIPTVTELSEQCEMARGNIQIALNNLKQNHVIRLESHGQNGTIATEIDYVAMAQYCSNTGLTCVMPMPYGLRYEGLASGLYEELNQKGVTGAIAFMRGSGYRLNCVEEGRFHLCVMSQLAFEHYAQEGKDIQLIAAFGPQSYVEQHRVFVRPDFKGDWQNCKVGVDASSVDQEMLTRFCFADKPVQYVPIIYSQLVPFLHSGVIDAGVWSADMLPEGLSYYPMPRLDEQEKDTVAVLACRKSDNITAQLVRKILSVERVDHIQQQVMRKQIIPRY